MKKTLAISLITGISLIMLFTAVGTAQMAEVTQETNVQDKCEIMKESLASATGLRAEYIQKQIDKYCS